MSIADEYTRYDELARRIIESFKSAWQDALTPRSPPSIESVLANVPEALRSTVRPILESLDEEFRRTGSRELADGWKPQHALFAQGTGPASSSASSVAAHVDEAVPSLLADTVSIANSQRSPSVPAAEETTQPWSPGTRPLGSSAMTGQPRIAGYEPLGILGRGGMGIVYKARQVGLNRVVALKMVLPQAQASPELLARFQTEAEAVAQLQHPNIVQVYEVGKHGELPYFSLEYVEGRSLAEQLKGSATTPTRAAEVVETVARAIQFAHDRRIVHRDLKPSNILLSKDGVPKVSDFGLVKRIEEDEGHTQSGAIVGTPSFMAPEQARSDKLVGPLADVYALGGVLYFMLTGRPPFVGTSPVDTVMQVLSSELVPPSRLSSATPKDLETICLKCLQKDEAKRYQSATEVAEDLRRFRAGEPITARPVSRAERIWRWCRRNPRLASVSGTALLLLVILAVGGPLAAFLIDEQRQVANAARWRAELSRQEAQRKRVEAQQQRALAVEAQGLAEEQAELAKNVNRSVVYLVHKKIEEQPALRPLRGEILDLALKGLEGVRGERRESAARQIVSASAVRELGELALEVGETERAIAHFDRALKIAREVYAARQFPHLDVNEWGEAARGDDGDWNLANVYELLGNAYLRKGDVQSAERHYEDMLKHRLQQNESSPKLALRKKQEIAQAYGSLGTAAKLRGDLQQARKYFEQDLRARQQWLELAPDNSDARFRYAGALSQVSNMALSLGDFTAAQRHADDSLAELRQLAVLRPDNRNLRFSVALKAGWSGYVRTATGDAAQGAAFYQQALDELGVMHVEDPENASIREKLAAFQYELANAQLQLGQYADASKHHAAALALRQALAEKDKGNSLRQADLLLSLARCGRVQEASELAAQLSEQHGDNPAILVRVACGESLCGEALADGNAPQPRDAPESHLAEEAEAYYQRALTRLQRCLELGFEEFVLLRIDPDLAALQDRADFQQLLEDAEAAAGNQRTNP